MRCCPSRVKERFADRPVFATGVYAAGINVGATVSSASAVPLEQRARRLARPAARVLRVTLALFVALARAHARSSGATSRPPSRGRSRCRGVARSRWRLVGAFFFMSATYYGLNAWLPDVYVEHGWSEGKAGALLAVLNGTQIAAGLAVAWLADRMWSRRAWMAGCSGLGFLSMLGVVLLAGRGLPLGVPARRDDRPALLADDGAAARRRSRPGRGGGLHRADAREPATRCRRCRRSCSARSATRAAATASCSGCSWASPPRSSWSTRSLTPARLSAERHGST